MNNNFKPRTEEQSISIVTGVFVLYFLVVAFILYLFFLHRITVVPMLISVFVFTLIYMPRLFIIKKIMLKDVIKISDNSINVNDKIIYFSEILDFRVEEKKPVVVFFINNSMVIYQEAIFHIKLSSAQISFTAIGTEKIRLLKEFLNRLLGK